MDIQVKFDCTGVDWRMVSKTLKSVGMGHYDPDLHKKAFENSYVTVFIYHDDRMIGFGRAISDGAYQASLYDIAVVPDFQGKGLGNTIISNIMDRLPECNIIMYSMPGREGFYEKYGFRRLKSGMGRFVYAELMAAAGVTE